MMNEKNDNVFSIFGAVDKFSSGDGGGPMDPRIEKLETHVEYIKRDISDMKNEVRDVRTALWAVLGILSAIMIGGFGIVMAYLLEIVSKLPQ